MAKEPQPPMMASGASPDVSPSSRPVVPVPPPRRVTPSRSNAPAPFVSTPSLVKLNKSNSLLEEAIFRPTPSHEDEVSIEILPPTLHNLTHPEEDDDVSQGNRHYRTLDQTDDILRRKLEGPQQGVGVFSELMIYWADSAMESSCPDIFVVRGLQRPPEEIENSFEVAREGVVPCLIFEIVSATYKSTRDKDYEFNKKHYAKAGVRELVLIEPLTQGAPEIRRVIGLRLSSSGDYEEIQPDASGRILLETVGFRIHLEKAAVVVEDAATGERFLTSSEEEAARKLAQERAAKEARARQEAERRAERSRAEALLTVLNARGFSLPDSTRERILATSEVERLDHWLGRAVVVTSLEDLFD